MKMMHIADLHIGKKVNGFSMIEDQEYILEQIKSIAVEQDISVLCIAGDVYDKGQPSEEAVRLLDKFLTDISNLNIKILMISGNHDSADRLSFGADLLEKSNIYIARKTVQKLKRITLTDAFGPVNFYFLPFVKPVEVRNLFPEENIPDYQTAVQKLLQENQPNCSERNVLLAHQYVTGAALSESEELVIGTAENIGVDLFSDFDYTALGHIHRPQSIHKNVVYAGSPLKYSFSEIDFNKSVPIIELKEKGEMTVEKIPLKPLHDMRRLKGTYNEVMFAGYDAKHDNLDYIQVILTDEDKEANVIQKLRSRYPNVMKVEYENARMSMADELILNDTGKELDPEKMIQEFYEKTFKAKMNEEQTEFTKKIMEKIWGVKR